jgi:hypothetical protein
MGVQKVILGARLQMELPSSDLAKKKMPHQPTFFKKLNYVSPQKCHISQLFSKSSTMCRPKMPHQPTFFKKLNYVSPPKMPHQPTFFKKCNYVSPQNATSANFFQKAQLCVAPKNATSATFFQKTQLCVTMSQKCYQCHMANLFLPFKLGTSVCGLCSQPLKCEL